MKFIKSSLISLALMTVLCGLIYPLVTTGIGHIAFAKQTSGSLVYNKEGQVIGSELLGQTYEGPGYLMGRPQEVTQLNPMSQEQAERVAERTAMIQAMDPANTQPIPADLVTASASGVDPHISPAAAQYQVPRIARERRIDEASVQTIIDAHTTGRTWGVFGEPVVNVLLVNQALDNQ